MMWILTSVPGWGLAQAVDPFAQGQDEAFAAEESFFEAAPLATAKLYGFIEAYVEKVAETPAGVENGKTVFEENPHEFDVPSLHVMVQGTIANQYRYFLNLAGPGSGSPVNDEHIVVRNAWVEIPVAGDGLQIRAGKTYRRFGLYNEVLDATPTFLGIEPPELFDKDHPLLTRTTNLMVHGRFSAGEHAFSYAIMTGNDEREGGQFPIGLDLSYELGTQLRFGTSFYTTAGDATPATTDDGDNVGGVARWMAKDSYEVFGAYGQVREEGLQVEAEFWVSPHRAERDPAAVLGLQGAGLNPRQLERFGLNGASPTEGDVPVKAEYTITTGYVRLGYAFETGVGEFTPYGQFDFYRNEETIGNKDFGGDNEAGLSDDGQFFKPTFGLIYRPDPAIALKVDGSSHIQKYNGETIQYPEVRASLSYLWQLEVL
jgi:hypothetical protein